MRSLLCLLLCCDVTFAYAGNGARLCTRADAILAEDEADSLDSWKNIYHSFKRFGHCDDGAIAEGYSGSVVSMLTQRWEQLDHVSKLIAEDQKFREFVLRHIDETMSASDFHIIIENAEKRCSQTTTEFCKSIAETVRALRVR